MKSKKYWITVVVLLAGFHLYLDRCIATDGKYFHSKANGYSIAIPKGWVKVPEDVVQKTLVATLTGEFRKSHKFEAVVAINLKENFIEYPYCIVQVIRFSDYGIKRPLKKNEIAYVVKAFTQLDVEDVSEEAVEKHISNDFKGVISEIEMNKVSIDEQNMVYEFRVETEIATLGRVRGLVIGHIGRYAMVQLMFYALDSDWSRLEEDRTFIFDSFQFDSGMRYEDASGKWSNILNRLGESAAKGLAYALIALFLGLIAGLYGLVKRLFRPKKKSVDEGILKVPEHQEDTKK